MMCNSMSCQVSGPWRQSLQSTPKEKKYIYPIRFRAPEAEEVVVGAPSSKQDYLTIQTLAAPPPPPARSSEQGRKMDKTRGGWKSLNQIRRINFNDIYFKSNLIGHECKYGLNFFFTLKYLNIMCIILSIKFLISTSPPHNIFLRYCFDIHRVVVGSGNSNIF